MQVTGVDAMRTRLPSTLMTVPAILLRTSRSLQYQGPGCADAAEDPAKATIARTAARLAIAEIS